MVKTPDVFSLDKLVSEAISELLRLHAHFNYLQRFERELLAVTREKRFHVRNMSAWLTMLHSRDMFVVHFASWAKNMYSVEFGRLAANTKSLYVSVPKRGSNAAEVDYDIRVRRREAFERRFPAASKAAKVRQEDVIRFKDEFEARVRVVVDDRSVNRAHPYETTGTAAMLTLKDLEEVLQYCKDVLDDLAMIAGEYTAAYHDGLLRPGTEETIQVLVDLIVLSHNPAVSFDMEQREIDVVGRMAHERRADIYERIHAAHDSGAPESSGSKWSPAGLFNDPHFVGDVLAPGPA